ncbi:MAG: histidine kinase [Bacteroidota bacterium]
MKALTNLLIRGLWVWLFSQAGVAFGQVEGSLDSLLGALESVSMIEDRISIHTELAFRYHTLDSSKALLHGRQAKTLAQLHQDQAHMALAYKYLGMTAAYWEDTDQAIDCYDSAYHYFQLLGDSAQMAAVLNNIGRRLCYVGEFEQAIEGYYQAESWAERAGDQQKLLIFSFNHAACLTEAGKSAETISLCQAILPLAEAQHNWYLQIELNSLLGISYGDLAKFDLAKAAYDQAFSLIKKMEPAQAQADMRARLHNNRGLLFLEQDAYQLAYDDFRLALLLLQESGLPQPNGEFFVNIGIAAKFLGKLTESKQYFEEGLRRLERTTQTIAIKETHRHLADLYQRIGMGQEAYESLQIYHQIQDSLHSIETEKHLQEVRVKYETARVKRELSESTLQIEKERYRFSLFKIGALALLLLGLLGYWFYHSRQKNKLLELQKRQVELQYGLLRAQMNPHFIFNALNAIQGFFVDHRMVQGNSFLGMFSSLIRRILDQSQLPVHSLAQELETLRLYLDIECERLDGQLGYTITLSEEVEEALLELPPMIFQPFVENAIWHGIVPKKDKGHIWINLRMDATDDSLLCTIKDNGVGWNGQTSQAQPHQSKGIAITRERLGERGEVSLQENQGETGITVNIRMSTVYP